MPLDDLQGAQPLENAPVETPPVEEHDEGEPEGTVEVQGRRMVDVGVVAAERKRAREAAEKKIRESEVAPLKAQADRAAQLEQALNAAKPYVDFLQARPELMKPQAPTPEEDRISEDEAATFARDYELFAPTGQPDIARAKKILARESRKTSEAARLAAQEAVAPVRQTAAEQASRANFAQMAQRVNEQGEPLVDPKVLAEEWVALAPELTADSRVAQVVLEKAIGKMILSGQRPQKPQRAPVFTESPGGRQAGAGLTDLDKKLGFSEKELKTLTTGFVPGGVSVIGE